MTETLVREAEPYPDWPKRMNVVGQHYVKAITYGGELIASLKFISRKSEERSKIEMSLEAGLTVGGALDAKVFGSFKKTVQSAASNSDLTISIFTTAELEKSPKDLDTFIAIIEDFPKKVNYKKPKTNSTVII